MRIPPAIEQMFASLVQASTTGDKYDDVDGGGDDPAVMVSAHDVARKLREALPGAGDVKVQKLLYYCQGWHLAFTDEPMFDETIEAWDMGPVVADLWHDETKRRPLPEPKPLGPSALATIGYVVERYGRLTGNDLINLTHAERPWLDTEASRFTNVISHQELREFFTADEDVRRLTRLGDELLRDPRTSQLLDTASAGAGELDDPAEVQRRLSEMRP
jgi:uncharacterized phage-associated protein